jgi:hypothetical protein
MTIPFPQVKTKAATTTTIIKSNIWKKVLLIPVGTGGTVFWNVVGTRADRTTFASEFRFFIIDPPQPVGNPNISSTTKNIIPTLTWESNCNTKFKVWFGNDQDFTKPGIKKKALSFNIKNPNDNGGICTKLLTKGQWMAIRKVVGDNTDSTIYWYVESWDGMGRYNRTDVMNFVLTD